VLLPAIPTPTKCKNIQTKYIKCSSGSEGHYATNLLLSAFDEQELAGSNATGFTTKKGVKKAKLDSK
jgi:hypothetical protein